MKHLRALSFSLILASVRFPVSSSSVIFCADSDRYPDLYEASIQELQSGLDVGNFTSVDLVRAYLARIDEVNLKNAKLRAVIETNQHAIEQAAALDDERKAKGKRSGLHGIPILLKDTIGTRSTEGMNTTAGSYVLLGSAVPDDSTVAARLREAGAILLGKTNPSEWSWSRDWNIPSGWSARGGQTTNPYYPGTDPSGSSSGNGVAMAVGLATGSLGTDAGGSIIWPSSYNNLVGIKPTVGLTSRAGVIPMSSHMDTVGPMTRSVADAAAILSVIAGRDDKDNYTSTAPVDVPDYTSFLNADALRGKRFGVPRAVFTDDTITGNHPSINIEFNKALETIRSLGGIVVDPADIDSAYEIPWNQPEVERMWQIELKENLNRYLPTLKYTNITSLADVIAFNDKNKDLEKPSGQGQTFFLESQSTKGYDSRFFSGLRYNHELGRERGIDGALRDYHLDALVLPSNGWTSMLASLAGYPVITVPLGFHPDDTRVKPNPPHLPSPAPGFPFGLAFLGTAYSEPDLIGFAYAYEQHTHTRLNRRAYALAVPSTQLKDVVSTCPKRDYLILQD